VRNELYGKFLQSLISKSRENDGEIMLSERDVNNHRTELEAFLKKNKLRHKISANKNISGGVIIKKDQKTYLGSLDIIGDLLSDELSIEAARILFEGGRK
jgi:vacuolar-type H+-ATPase subunit E/Vma4